MIGFLLLAAVQTTASAAPATPPDAPKMRCRSSFETGSNVKKKRVCHTDAEWRALDRRDDIELNRMRDRTPVNSQRPVG
ncbi:hypothetical protein [Sphingomonas sp. S2-65]|uniref:hypothetical protein n=1 Tax=Sphingomonas sp. S2-65 TaxID=2903960 RepID=UPI001F2897B7|nr:hypothetical protein [Sphingomonas sp. S2-65]UYY57638.1 hypothetical protein LZ586_13345 [Sphingomonas sp. S2-65]